MADLKLKKFTQLPAELAHRAIGLFEDTFVIGDENNEPQILETGGLSGSQYLFVPADGTDVENAAQLQDAYDEAKTMSPSATNRITVIAAPANYNFSSNFVMNEEYVDLVSLDGNRSIIFNGSGTISITANDVYVKGVDVQTKNFTIGDNLNLLKVENCIGGNFSFGGFGTASGTFTNCQGGDFSFGGEGTASGTFTNCQGGDFSFGGEGAGEDSFGAGTASGTFTNCQGGNFSFGGFGTASGIFNNCEGNNFLFGAFGTASGTFTNCVGGQFSFGNGGTLSGKLYYCRLISGTFVTVSGSGVTVLCIDGDNQINTQN